MDNFDHITAYWVGLGLKLAQVALNYGADDLHGTIVEENIFHMAGARTPQLQTEAEMIKAIRETGRIPVQRDTFYQADQSLGRRAAGRRRGRPRPVKNSGGQPCLGVSRCFFYANARQCSETAPGPA